MLLTLQLITEWEILGKVLPFWLSIAFIGTFTCSCKAIRGIAEQEEVNTHENNLKAIGYCTIT